MSSETPNLKIKLYNTTTDLTVSTMEWLPSINGEVETSAMNKIDSAIGTLQTNFDNTSNIIKINATSEESTPNMYTCTTTKIAEYVEDDVICLIPNRNNTGSATLKINSLDAVNLKNINTSGTKIDLAKNDLLINHEYYFRYDGTDYVLQISNNTSVTGESGNIISIGTNNNIEDSGIGLNDIVTISDDNIGVPYKKLLKDKEGNQIVPKTKIDAVYNDNGDTLDTLLNSKLNTSDVVNTNTQVETDKKSLNAVQNNATVSGTLANKIQTINTDLGATTLTTTAQNVHDAINEHETGITKLNWAVGLPKVPSINLADANTIVTTCGVFVFNASNVPNSDYGLLETFDLTSVGFTPSPDAVIIQHFTSYNSGKFYTRKYNSDNGEDYAWSNWIEMATMTNTPFTVTAATGIKIEPQTCYKIGGTRYMTLSVEKTDNSELGNCTIGTLPFTVNRIIVCNCMYGLPYWVVGNAYIDYDSTIKINTSSTAKYAFISVVF